MSKPEFYDIELIADDYEIIAATAKGHNLDPIIFSESIVNHCGEKISIFTEIVEIYLRKVAWGGNPGEFSYHIASGPVRGAYPVTFIDGEYLSTCTKEAS